MVEEEKWSEWPKKNICKEKKSENFYDFVELVDKQDS